jgi:hypothetical protein
MKKPGIILSVLITIAISTYAQIPNNGFEYWNPQGNCLKPEGWYCTNDILDTTGNYFGITRSNDHYPFSVGSFSIKIENNTALLPGWAGMGFAWTGGVEGSDNPVFPITGHPESFCGYYKFMPDNHDTMRIFISLYKNGNEVSYAKLMDTITVSDWSPFILPFQTYSEADSARIFLSSFNSDGAMVVQGNSALYVDNLSFNTLIASDDELSLVNNSISVFPNPAHDKLNLFYNAKGITFLKIFNTAGELVTIRQTDPDLTIVSFAEFSPGIYFYQLSAKSGGILKSGKFLKE